MTETAKSPSTWFLSRARTALCSLVAAGLVALFLVPAAHASGTSTADREQVSLASETAPPAAEPPPTASETLPPPASEPPPPVSEAPPPSDEPPPRASEAPPPSDEPPPPASEAQPPSDEPPPPASAAAPPSAEPPPPASKAPPPSPREGVAEQPTGESAAESGAQGISAENAPGGSESSASPPADGSEREVAPRVPQAAAGSTVVDPSAAISMSSAPSHANVAAEPPKTPPSRSRQLGCGVAGLLAALGSNQLDIAGVSALSTAPVASADAPATAIGDGVGVPIDRDGGWSSIASHPPPPAPEPAPGGAGGGSAAGSGSGAGTSTPVTPVSLLLQAAPTHAMWRSRLSQPSLRTSFFALIPERPD